MPKPLDPVVLEQAADWLTVIHSGAATATDYARFEQWRSAHKDHARACQQAEQLIGKLGTLPPQFSTHMIERSQKISLERRRMLKLLTLACVAIPSARITWSGLKAHGWMADYSTALGERRDLTLEDGTQVTLNTSSAINVHYNHQQRYVELVGGEMLVQTAADNTARHRPFMVGSANGLMTALGTRFSVRNQNDDRTHIAVFEGAVRLQPSASNKVTSQVLQAGQQTSFTRTSIAAPVPAHAATLAWVHGMFSAYELPLISLVNELKRYHRGYIHCDPAIAQLLVSGNFPVTQLKQTVEMLEATYWVDASYLVGGYWVALTPRSSA